VAAVRSVTETPPPSTKYFNPAKYQAEYRATHKTEIMVQKTAYFCNKHAILRSKLLGNLNNGVVTKPEGVDPQVRVEAADNGLWETTQAADYKPSEHPLEDANVQA